MRTYPKTKPAGTVASPLAVAVTVTVPSVSSKVEPGTLTVPASAGQLGVTAAVTVTGAPVASSAAQMPSLATRLRTSRTFQCAST